MTLSNNSSLQPKRIDRIRRFVYGTEKPQGIEFFKSKLWFVEIEKNVFFKSKMTHSSNSSLQPIRIDYSV